MRARTGRFLRGLRHDHTINLPFVILHNCRFRHRCTRLRSSGYRNPASCILTLHACALLPEARARCGNSARRDLCGGCRVTGRPYRGEGEHMGAVAPRVDWFFGRGLSMGCRLPWSVPDEWRHLHRDEQIARIKETLRFEMDRPSVDCSDIRDLLRILSEHTVPPWRHLFITTNWDFLLQREVLALGHTDQPAWSAETHVYHLNGTSARI